MTPESIRAFADEVQRIKVAFNMGALGAAGAGLGRVASGAKSLMHAGLFGAPGNPAPRWAQALTLAGPALAMPGALAKEDPTGQGRSRAERLTGLAGNTAASLAFGGAVSKATAGIKNPWLSGAANVGAGMLAGDRVSHAAESVATAPWQAARKLQSRKLRTTQADFAPKADESFRTQSPAQSPPAMEGRQNLL